jgi:hypothetical protein
MPWQLLAAPDIIGLARPLTAISVSLVPLRAATGVASNGLLDAEDENRETSHVTREEHLPIAGNNGVRLDAGMVEAGPWWNRKRNELGAIPEMSQSRRRRNYNGLSKAARSAEVRLNICVRYEEHTWVGLVRRLESLLFGRFGLDCREPKCH